MFPPKNRVIEQFFKRITPWVQSKLRWRVQFIISGKIFQVIHIKRGKLRHSIRIIKRDIPIRLGIGCDYADRTKKTVSSNECVQCKPLQHKPPISLTQSSYKQDEINCVYWTVNELCACRQTFFVPTSFDTHSFLSVIFLSFYLMIRDFLIFFIWQQN